MEKFTQAPVGLDIDQTVSSNSTAITNLSNKVSKEVTDLNSQITGLTGDGNDFGWYRASATNKPGSNSGYVQASRIGNYVLQFAVDLVGTPYTRYKDAGGTITSWQALAKQSDVTTLQEKTAGIYQTGVGDSTFNIRFTNDANNHQMALFVPGTSSAGYKLRMYDVTAGWVVMWTIT